MLNKSPQLNICSKKYIYLSENLPSWMKHYDCATIFQQWQDSPKQVNGPINPRLTFIYAISGVRRKFRGCIYILRNHEICSIIIEHISFENYELVNYIN